MTNERIFICEKLGSQEQMNSLIQSLIRQYNFEKFDIAN